MRLNPVLANLGTYPFVRLEHERARLRAAGVKIIDFGVGEPREETPAFIRDALAAAITPMAPYPSAAGLPELRAAIAGWAARRFQVTLDPDTEIVPTLGSKEAVFSLANVFGGDLVAVPTPSYPVYERGAVFADKQVVELPLDESTWLPRLDGVDWDRVAVLWLNYPNNPTGARAPLAFYEQAAALAREHDFVLASDEAYSELYFAGDPPGSALQLSDRTNVAVFNTLSKRSSMPGYRSGFVAGDPDIVAALKQYRPNVGVAPLEFVQRAAVAAWGNETHVEAVRERYRAKRDALLPALESLGLRDAGGDATFFLWMDAGQDADALAARWLDAGVVVAPGSFFGAPRYLRIALVPTPEDCARAAEIVTGLA
ncbi:MAG TPA: aminotransferase class I/II-fold pyridoxal phosphate-dependent enzyme [Solirubrobacter sp.]|nr:aminotransferase class I/II-fold pyridoxal phosphate-dependent enzyme [Solirubrobacter sp.]